MKKFVTASCGPERLPFWHLHRWVWEFSTLNDDHYTCRCGTRIVYRSQKFHMPAVLLDYDWLMSSNKG